MKQLLIVAVMAMSFALGANAETKTTVFNVNPKMSCQNCENKIKSNLRYEKGVKDIKTSLDDQTVTVTYDDAKTSPEKIASGFKKIGYTAAEGAAAKACKAKACCKEKAEAACKEVKSCCKEKAEAACKEVKSCCKEKTAK